MTVTRRDIEKHLWDASNILRGSVDASEFKNFIVGLLFLKRLSDVYDEIARNEPYGASTAQIIWENLDGHTYQIPTEAHWNTIPRLWYQDIGDHLNHVSELLEKKNPLLKGILTTIDFTRLPRDTLIRLVSHFDQIRLGNEDLIDPDLLGRAYEYLIAKFAEKAKQGGEFYTPHNVVRLLVELLRPEENMWICDPTSGSGGLLLQCVEFLRRLDKKWQTLSLFGQESNPQTWALSKINMILHGINARIELGDTIRNPKLVKDGHLLSFDLVIANPPFSLKEWGRDVAENDPYNRFKLGIPPKSIGDMAFLQHMISTLRSNGRLGIILPHGVLFRGGAERKIRKSLVEEDLIEAIVGLPPNLFYGTSIPACILILDKSKPPNRKFKIQFINAFSLYDARPSQNKLSLKHIEKIMETYSSQSEYPQFSRMVSIKEIRDMMYNLNISLYVDISTPDPQIDVQEIWQGFHLLENVRQSQIEQVQKVIEQVSESSSLSSSNIDTYPKTWYTAKLGDLVTIETGKRAKGGALKSGEVASIGGEHIKDGRISWETIKYIPDRIYMQLAQGKVILHDILVVKDGATTGKVAFVRSLPYERTAVNEHVFLIRTRDPNQLDAEFLYYIMESSIGQNQIKKRFHGIIGGINRIDVKSIRIPVPPIKEQRRIVQILASLETHINLTYEVSQQVKTLKKGLMQHLLSGQLGID
ncbi:MAG: N-6 DNA methylase [Candidatus Heimdallarchaeota archaeon]